MSSPIVRPEDEPQFHPRNPFARPGPIPDLRLEALYYEKPPSLVARADSSTTSSTPATTTSCGPHDTSGACERYFNSDGSNNTLPIVLGVVIPLGIALIVLIFLHRRHVKKLRREDAEDKHKSLDFGLEVAQQTRKKNGQKGPEMSMAEKKEIGFGRRPRGLSLDMGPNNPYLLPPELQHSRESLHSLARSINTGDDRYRTTNFIPDDGSIRAPSSLRKARDDSSSYTGSLSQRFQLDSQQNLLRNAQDNPTGRSPSSASGRDTSVDPFPGSRKPLPQPSSNNLLAPAMADPARDSFASTASSGAMNALRASNNYLAQFISGGTAPSKVESNKKGVITSVSEINVDRPVIQVQEPPSVVQLQAPPPAVVKDEPRSAPQAASREDNTSAAPSITLSLADDRQPRLPQFSFINTLEDSQRSIEADSVPPTSSTASNHTPQPSSAPSTDFPHLDKSSRAEPIDHNHHQDPNAEDDYYDEYEVYGSQEHQQYPDYVDYQDYQDYQSSHGNDPRRLTMGMRPLPPDDPSEDPEQRANRIRSFYKEYFDEQKLQQLAQPVQYYDGAEGYYESHGGDGFYEDHYEYPANYPPRGMSQNGTYGRHRATISNGSYSYQAGPRSYSSASARYGPRRPYMPPKKMMPPPKALHILPTPSKLKEDTFLPIDFAPPQKFQNQRAGTPDSPRGGIIPYSPSTRAHVPLASSFDDLAVIPSP